MITKKQKVDIMTLAEKSKLQTLERKQNKTKKEKKRKDVIAKHKI